MMKKLLKNRYFVLPLSVAGGILIGWLLFHPHTGSTVTNVTESHNDNVTDEVWTCSMHPQIKLPEPGKCPICGMNLIPLTQASGYANTDAIHMTREAAELANVNTSVVSRQRAVKNIRLYGKVATDERLIQSQIAQVPGRIETLMVNFTGETVKKGQPLAVIYSPGLVTAQQELIEAARTKSDNPEIYEAAKERMRQWKLSDEQIESIEESSVVQSNLTILSGTSGIITEKKINIGDYVSRGEVLFEVADLSSLWITFDTYETDLQFLKTGDRIDFTIEALPGESFSGRISFIDPVIDPVTRVARVRIDAGNTNGRLKPGMFATGTVTSELGDYKNSLVIPATAVLWTGKRSVVYVKDPGSDDPLFQLREIILGPALGDNYVVSDGLSEGEVIVTEGAFSVDAAAQLEGKRSMMNIPAEKTGTADPLSYNAKKPAPDTDFMRDISNLYEQYIVLKNDFVGSNPEKVTKEAQRLLVTIKGIKTQDIDGDLQKEWRGYSTVLIKQAEAIASYDDIKKQRASFVLFNDTFYKVIKAFGINDRTVYYQFCPMANDGKGAYWLSETEGIRNPYYGDEMLTCGEVREVIR